MKKSVMPDPEFNFKLEISSKGKGGIRHILAVTALLLVLLALVIGYILYLVSH
jgi:hypothetical protein